MVGPETLAAESLLCARRIARKRFAPGRVGSWSVDIEISIVQATILDLSPDRPRPVTAFAGSFGESEDTGWHLGSGSRELGFNAGA